MKKNHYFDTLIIEINKKISQKQYQDAYALIAAELKAPYIPSDFEKQFLQLQKSLASKIVNDKPPQSNSLINPDVIIQHLTSSNANNASLEWVMALEQVNLRDYVNEIAIFLKNYPNDPFAKTFILEILKKQEINQNFVIKKFDQEFIINPYHMKSLTQYPEYHNVINLFMQNLESNPNLLMTCVEIWKWYTYLIFPKLPKNFTNFEIWVSTIIYYVLKLQKQEIDLVNLSQKYHVSVESITKLFKELEILKEV